MTESNHAPTSLDQQPPHEPGSIASPGDNGITAPNLRELADELLRLSNQVAADRGLKPTRVRVSVEYDCHSPGGGH